MIYMNETIFMTAQEVADILGVSEGLAYKHKMIKDMNKQLQKMTILLFPVRLIVIISMTIFITLSVWIEIATFIMST